jgi:hypothetical protein
MDPLQKRINAIQMCGLTRIEAERVAMIRVPRKLRHAPMVASVLASKTLRKVFDQCPIDPYMQVTEWVREFGNWAAKNKEALQGYSLDAGNTYIVGVLYKAATGQLP